MIPLIITRGRDRAAPRTIAPAAGGRAGEFRARRAHARAFPFSDRSTRCGSSSCGDSGSEGQSRWNIRARSDRARKIGAPAIAAEHARTHVAVAPRFALDREALRSRRVIFPDEESLPGTRTACCARSCCNACVARLARDRHRESRRRRWQDADRGQSVARARGGAEPDHPAGRHGSAPARSRQLLGIPEGKGVESVLRGEIDVDEVCGVRKAASAWA